MNKMMLFMSAALLLIGNCGEAPVTGGGGASETVATVIPYEDGIRVSVQNDDTFTVAVKIYDKAFTRFDTGYFRYSAVLSNDHPECHLPVPPESTLHIFVIDSSNGTAAFFRHVNSSGSAEPQEKKLTSTGEVSGIVSLLLTDGNSVPAAGYRVLIPGSPFDAVIGSEGFYRLSGVPEGNYTLETRNELNPKVNSRSRDSIVIEITREQIYQQDIILKQ
jgi:hypothetical protein